MAEIDTRIEAGTILAIETGSYSDKEFHGPVRALKTFTLREVGEAMCVAHAREHGWKSMGPSEDLVLPFMVANGYVEDIGGSQILYANDFLTVERDRRNLERAGPRYEILFSVMARGRPESL